LSDSAAGPNVRPVRRLVGIGVVVALLSGCAWTQVGGSARRNGVNPLAPGVTLGTLDQLGTAWTSNDHGALTDQEVIVRDDHVLAPGSDALWSVDLATGADQWHVNRTFGYQTNRLGAVSTWTAAGHDVVAMPQSWYQSVAGTVYFKSIAADTDIDLATGTPISTGQPGAGFAPLAGDGWVYVPNVQMQLGPPPTGSFSDVWVEGRALDGSATFRVPLTTGARVPSAMATDGTTLFIVVRDALLAVPAHGCGAATCDPVWSAPFPSGSTVGAVAVTDGAVLVLERSGTHLWSLPLSCPTATCSPTWTATLPANGTGLAATDTTVYVTSGTTLASFPAGGCGAATCSAAWTSAPDAGMLTEPTVVNDVVLTGSATGSVLAWPRPGCGSETCSPATSMPQGAAVGPVTPIPGALLFPVGGAVRKLALPTG
jgi:hypothetical protein